MTNQRQNYAVPFGHGSIEFQLPAGMTADVVTSQPAPALSDPAADFVAALRQPFGSVPLLELARDKRKICIAVTDATRSCPDHLILPPMLDAIADAGVPDTAVTILVAVGVHRASTPQEKREKLGAAIVERYRVIDHDASNPANLVDVAPGPGGTTFRLNRLAVETDLLLATGVVEPHQYAGFSGGGKTVAIGCADDAVIGYTHGPAMLDRPGVRLAQLDGNPFQAAVRTVAQAAGLAFVGNAVLNEQGEPVAIAYGAPEAVHDHLAAFASRLYTAPIPRQVDIAIAGVGSPKDANLYQASRAASYLQFAPTPVVRPGGVIILPARCPEGAGQGAGEQRFFAAMSEAPSPAALVARIRADGGRPGEQRAFIMARVLEEVAVIVTGSEHPDIAEACGFFTAPDIASALDMAQTQVGSPAHALIVPHALLTLPLVQPLSPPK